MRGDDQQQNHITKGFAGVYTEQFGWSHLISDGQEGTLPAASMDFRQQFTLDPAGRSILPDLRLIPGS